MTEMSAHLVDSVLPIVPVRQWVLTLPFPLRYDLAWNHDRTRKVLGELNRMLEDFYCAKAAARGIEGGRSGSVTVIQRVGSAINLNPHFHNLSLDGVFTQKPGEPPEFHPVGLVTDEDVAEVTALVRDRVLRLLRSEAVLEGDDASFSFDDLSDDSPSLSEIYCRCVGAGTHRNG